MNAPAATARATLVTRPAPPAARASAAQASATATMAASTAMANGRPSVAKRLTVIRPAS